MKTLAVFLLGTCLLAAGCGQDRTAGQKGTTGMAMDSIYQKDPEVTVVLPKGTIRLDESLKNLKDYPNITMADLDAEQGVENKDVVYVKRGDQIRLGEGSRGK